MRNLKHEPHVRKHVRPLARPPAAREKDAREALFTLLRACNAHARARAYNNSLYK